MDKKIAVIIKSRVDASSYYRLYQYFSQIKQADKTTIVFEQIPQSVYLWYYNSKHASKLSAKLFFWLLGTVRTFCWIEMDRFFFHSDILILNRKFYARKMPVIQKYRLKSYLKRKKLIWDFDDNIVDDKEISKSEFELVSEYSEKIVVTSEYLRGKLSILHQKKTILLPTTDMDLYQFDYVKSIEERLKIYETCINLLWLGSRNNVGYLELWISELDRIAGRIKKEICLYVVCNKEFNWPTEKLVIQNIRWDRVTAIKIMQKCHLGLMPLREDKYTLGKAGFKLVQYFGAGIPAAASPVGYNHFVIEEEKNGYLINGKKELNKIRCLLENKEKWKAFAMNARSTYEEKFNPQMILNEWKTMLNNTGRIS